MNNYKLSPGALVIIPDVNFNIEQEEENDVSEDISIPGYIDQPMDIEQPLAPSDEF